MIFIKAKTNKNKNRTKQTSKHPTGEPYYLLPITEIPNPWAIIY